MARRYSGEAFTQEFVLLFGFLSGLWFYAGLKPFRHIYIVKPLSMQLVPRRENFPALRAMLRLVRAIFAP